MWVSVLVISVYFICMQNPTVVLYNICNILQYSSPSIIRTVIIQTLDYLNTFEANTTIKLYIALTVVYRKFTNEMATKCEYNWCYIYKRWSSHFVTFSKGVSKCEITREYSSVKSTVSYIWSHYIPIHSYFHWLLALVLSFSGINVLKGNYACILALRTEPFQEMLI